MNTRAVVPFEKFYQSQSFTLAHLAARCHRRDLAYLLSDCRRILYQIWRGKISSWRTEMERVENQRHCERYARLLAQLLNDELARRQAILRFRFFNVCSRLAWEEYSLAR